MHNSKSGFTLIEILIVVTIIALLSSVVLVGLQPARTAARDVKRMADLNEVRNGLELYFNKCGYYPGLPVPSLPCGKFAQISSWAELSDALTESNLDITRIPAETIAGEHYLYATSDNGRQYVVGAVLEDPNNSALLTSLHNDKLPFSVPFSCDPPVYCIRL